MERGNLYHRKMRAKHIRRKKRITSYYAFSDFPYYRYDGMYSKNKIHCSCPFCASKTNDKNSHYKCGKTRKNWKHTDLQKLLFLHNQIVDLIET